MSVTESTSLREKTFALFLTLGVVENEYYGHLGTKYGLGLKVVSNDLYRLLMEDPDPQLPYRIWSGLKGLEVQQKFFGAYAYEIGKAGSSDYWMRSR